MENKTYRLGYHLTVFLDVQGQREKFKGLCLPKTPEEHAVVQEVLKDTAGFVVGLRDACIGDCIFCWAAQESM
jgi:hypothetical protein